MLLLAGLVNLSTLKFISSCMLTCVQYRLVSFELQTDGSSKKVKRAFDLFHGERFSTVAHPTIRVGVIQETVSDDRVDNVAFG